MPPVMTAFVNWTKATFYEVINLSFQDYRETFGEPESRIEELRTLLRA